MEVDHPKLCYYSLAVVIIFISGGAVAAAAAGFCGNATRSRAGVWILRVKHSGPWTVGG